jgi:hypothetical protein
MLFSRQSNDSEIQQLRRAVERREFEAKQALDLSFILIKTLSDIREINKDCVIAGKIDKALSEVETRVAAVKTGFYSIN